MQQPGTDKCRAPVCESSDLLLRFLNTGALSGRADLLASPEDLTAWLARTGLASADTPVSGADALAARELRDAFLTILRAHSGSTDGETGLPAAEEYIQHVADRYPLIPRLCADGYRLVPAQEGVLGGFGALFAAAVDLAAHGAWVRLKICKDPSCCTGFFDKTRNSSGLYCSSACSTRMAVRAYRSRVKKTGELDPVDPPTT